MVFFKNAQLSSLASLPSDLGLIQCAEVQPALRKMSVRLMRAMSVLTVVAAQSRTAVSISVLIVTYVMLCPFKDVNQTINVAV